MTTVVLASGGLDSTVLLYDLRQTDTVIAVSIDYGQRHKDRELRAARAICQAAGVEQIVLTIPRVQSAYPAIPDGHYNDEAMKAIVFPNRNMILLALAAGIAVDRKAERVAYAAHGGDHVIYPDCRPEFVTALRDAILVGNWNAPILVAPFLDIDKAGIVRRGVANGAPLWRTYSCYRGGVRHCGTCGTCTERIEAFELAGVPDPTVYPFTPAGPGPRAFTRGRGAP